MSSINDIKARLKQTYEYKNKDYIPHIVNHMFYWMDGEAPENIPANYFKDPKVMTDFQLAKAKLHQEHIQDDYVPFLMPWYGTGVLPSAMGCEIVHHETSDPSVRGGIISDPSQVKDLKKPDFRKDGQCVDVLKTIAYMRDNTDLPIGYTDVQGPLNVALNICGVENLFMWMMMNPEETHQLMEFSTEILIDWIKEQKKEAGEGRLSGNFPHGIYLPEEFGNVWIADDDCTQISAEQYKEFVVPYNSKVMKAFGGGTIHFCSSAKHQLQNLLDTEGVVGINNFCMGDFEQVKMMQDMFKNKYAMMVCDFSPVNPEKYYEELFSFLKPEGKIVASFVASRYALQNGTYVNIEQDTLAEAKKIDAILKGYV